MTIEQIKEQLKTIRLYYADKAGFDAAFSVLPHKVITLAKQYAEVISNAPLDLYLIFYHLYVKALCRPMKESDARRKKRKPIPSGSAGRLRIRRAFPLPHFS